MTAPQPLAPPPDAPTLTRRGPGRAVRVPELLAPEAVADAWRKLRAFSIERRSLNDQPSTDALKRRASALALLVDDTTRELYVAVDTTREDWAAALDARIAETADTHRQTLEALDDARAAATSTGQVLTWLDDTVSSGLRPFRAHPQRRLAGARPWDEVITALRDELEGDLAPVRDIATELTPRLDRNNLYGGTIRDVVVQLPELALPAVLDKPYRQHRKLLGQHHALAVERRTLEATRQDAEAKDRRALADSIAAGTDDPGDIHQTQLGDQVHTLDVQRATLTAEIRETHGDLVLLLREHRDAWRNVLMHQHADAVTRYAAAVEQLPDTRHALHHTQAVRAWLDTTTPGDLGNWNDGGRLDRRYVQLLGQPFDVTLGQFRDDVAADRQLAATPTGGQAA
jgi:hypothetical protein